MRSLRVGFAAGALGLALLAGCTDTAAPKNLSNAMSTTIATIAPPSTTTPAPAWNGTGPGDGPPDEGDNGLFPRSISPADQQAVDAAEAKVKTALVTVRRSGSVTVTKVRSALVKAGFDHVDTKAMPAVPATKTTVATPATVAFGITVGVACVEGSVGRTKLDVAVQGPVPDWGCDIVGPTH